MQGKVALSCCFCAVCLVLPKQETLRREACGGVGGQKQCQDFNPVQGTGSVCLHSRDKGLIALHCPAGKQGFPENRFTE